MESERKFKQTVDAEETANFISGIDLNKRNSAVPKPPSDGYIICQYCGNPLSLDSTKNEKKWQVHDACKRFAISELNRLTPGYLSEKRAMEKRIRANEANKNNTTKRRRTYLEIKTNKR